MKLQPTIMAPFELNDLFKDSVSKYSPILKFWGLEFRHVNFGKGMIQTIIPKSFFLFFLKKNSIHLHQ